MKIFMIKLKKWWKISLIVSIAVFILIYYVFLKEKKEDSNTVDSTKLREGLDEIKEKISEVSNRAVVETAIAKKEVEDVKVELAEIAKDKDAVERRKRMAVLANRVLNE
jgi:low affinity Fe/Cu permease